MDEKASNLLELYEKNKKEIEARLKEFQETINYSDEKIFAELAFCICTPQSKATVCWNAINSLMKNNLLYVGNKEKIMPFLNAVRFGETKSGRIIEARKLFTENNKLNIKKKILSFSNSHNLRDWLVKNVKGLGLKESSHFIRNIGFDYKNQLAILDRHILKNLVELGVIEKIPKTLTKRQYLEVEGKMENLGEKIGLSLYELDLLLWSKETGKIFK